MKKYLNVILISFIFVLAFFLRFNNLSTIPEGLEQDETSIGYNAYSILLTGKDEYGKPFPLSFKAFGEYKLPGYIYTTILPIKLFGLNEFSIRFASALSGSLTIIVFYFLLKILFKNIHEALPLTATILLTINPWHLHLSRGGFEVTLALFFIVLGTYLWVLAAETNKKFLFFLSLLVLIASVYTYNIARVFTPLLFVFLVIFYKKYFLHAKKTATILFLFAGVLLIPFAFQVVSRAGVEAVKGTLITSSAVVQAPLIEMREYMANMLPLSVVKVFFNLPALTVWHYINNIVSYLSVNYLFVSGSTHGNHGIGTSGQFYIFEALFILFGIVEIFKKKYTSGYFFLIWTILVVFIASFTRDVPQATRSLFMVVPIEVFSGLGLLMVVHFISKIKNAYVAKGLLVLLIIFGIFNIFYYFTSYYIRFPIVYAKDWRQQDKPLSLYLQRESSHYTKIIFDTKAGFEYSSFLFYTQYSPAKFQATVRRAPDDSEGFSQVLSFGKYEFKDVDFTKDYQSGTLIVTTIERKPATIPSLASFAYPIRPVAFAVGQDVVSYPVQDFAYVVIGKK